MKSEYSSAAVEAFRGFEYWSDVVCHHCIPAASRALGDAPFAGSLVVRSVGAVDVDTIASTPHHWSRRPHHLRQSPDDDLWLGYVQDGTALVEQGGRQARVASGDMVLYDASRPFEVTLATGALHMVRMARQQLGQHSGRCRAGAEHLTARVIRQDQPGAAPLAAMIAQSVALDFEALPRGIADRFGDTLLDLVAVTLDVQLGEGESAPLRDLRERIVAYIAKHLDDPDLSVASLAHAHRVCARTVTRAFARHQQTPMGMVWQLRLEASRRALAEGRSRSVTDAALDHGFSDLSHFSRAFRRAFGVAPRTLVRRHDDGSPS